MITHWCKKFIFITFFQNNCWNFFGGKIRKAQNCQCLGHLVYWLFRLKFSILYIQQKKISAIFFNIIIYFLITYVNVFCRFENGRIRRCIITTNTIGILFTHIWLCPFKKWQWHFGCLNLCHSSPSTLKKEKLKFFQGHAHGQISTCKRACLSMPKN